MRNGLAPVYEMVRRGVNVAMGLDDKTINDDEDAVMELRMLHKLHRVPSYDLRTPAARRVRRARHGHPERRARARLRRSSRRARLRA